MLSKLATAWDISTTLQIVLYLNEMKDLSALETLPSSMKTKIFLKEIAVTEEEKNHRINLLIKATSLIQGTQLDIFLWNCFGT